MGDVHEPAVPDRESWIEVNRTRLRTWEWGDPSAPPVFCLHGAHDHGRMFDELAPAAAELGYHVVAFDLRGHGDSGPLGHGLMVEVSALDLGLVAAEFATPVGFIAHSMGASIAMQTAMVWPERVAWLVSLDGIGPPPGVIGLDPIEQEATQALNGLIKTLGRGRRVFIDVEAMADQRGALNARLPRHWLMHLARHGSIEVDGGLAWKWDPLLNTYLPTAFDVDWVEEDMRRIECPVLVLHGTADDLWSFPVEAIAARTAHLTDVRTVGVDDAGHYVHLEQPAFVLGQITGFLDEVG